ncbi:MAG: hypothetical protein HYY06_06330 [Deltaproteobacteria bacterium]|nr:hypothetical protein [Deltaproteobacteria bacterium]
MANSEGAIRPLAKALRLDVVHRTQASRIAPGIVELVLSRASVISEGAVRSGIAGRETYFGSSMLTIDLEDLAKELRVPVDARLAEDLARRLPFSAHLKVHALRIARDEAERRVPGRSADRFSAELKVRAAATRLEVDVDVEMPLAAATGRARSGRST